MTDLKIYCPATVSMEVMVVNDDTGQNRLTPSDDRWKARAETYSGWSAAFAEQWGGELIAA